MTHHDRRHLTTAQTVDAGELTKTLAELRAEMAAIHSLLKRVDMQPRPDWVTLKEYARLSGQSIRTVQRKAKSGEIETKEVAGVRMAKVV